MTLEIVSIVSLAIIFPLTTRALGVDGYGEYTVLYLIFALAGLWVHAAPSAALVQLILQLGHDSASALRTARRQTLVATAPAVVMGVALAVALLGWDILPAAVLAFGVDFVFLALSSLNLAVVFAVEGVVPSSTMRLIAPLLRVIGVVALAVGGVISIVTIVVVNIVASGVLFGRSERAVRRITRGGEGQAPRLHSRELLRYTSFYGTSMTTNAVQNEGEKLVLATTRPPAEVGQYAASYRLVSLTLIPLSAVIGAANRWFLVRDGRPRAQVLRTARLSVPAAIYGVMAGCAVFLGRDLVEWAAGPEFDDAALMAAWLCLLPLLHGLAELPPMGLLGLGRNRERMFLGIGTSAAAVGLYLLLVPTLGWRGAIIGTYASELASVLVGWLLLARYQRIDDRRSLVGQDALSMPGAHRTAAHPG
jgi:O-antigen/teichoic acid export membrane protein